eukprot:CAMPEP_0194480216 /NCGR_PEP_ID=MMETSP0253-20130528/3096_1 /TAXON_ID=2966 /ORGANISM="Noctiluca scintillans" /LENGTH=74 /DNA_ID=CAMNT_0039319571 /DNA_START=379 /DNA_END=600 /DNA_ORIENTATION=-
MTSTSRVASPATLVSIKPAFLIPLCLFLAAFCLIFLVFFLFNAGVTPFPGVRFLTFIFFPIATLLGLKVTAWLE